MPRVVTFSPSCPGSTSESVFGDLVEKLGVDQVHLTQIGLRRIAGDARSVLDCCAGMSVALDAPPLDEDDLLDDRLAELMLAVAAHRHNLGQVFSMRVHGTILAHSTHSGCRAGPAAASIRPAAT